MSSQSQPAHDATPILQTAFGFWPSKMLLTAVEMGVFTTHGSRRLTGADLGRERGLHPRGISVFFDGLVDVKSSAGEENGPSASYFNTPAGSHFLDRNSPRYV